MKKVVIGGAILVTVLLGAMSVEAKKYKHGWKVYDKPQSGANYTYGHSYETNPYGPGGSKSYGPGGGNSYGAGGGKSYGPSGGNSHGPGGGRNPANPWSVAQ